MEKNILTEFTRLIHETEEISLETIPDMELYMDQLLSFLNQRLSTAGDNPDAKVFTKTMINNYTKDRLLIPPKNKKYSKQHILLLILIYNLKGSLSINDIKRLFEPILRDIDTPDDDLIPLEDIYTSYLDLTENYLTEFSETFTNKLSFIKDKTANLEGEANINVAQLFLSVLVLITQANLSKKMAEFIIESYFPNQITSDDAPQTMHSIDLGDLFAQPNK